MSGTKKVTQLLSRDGRTKLHVVLWIPEKVQLILQISHGMKEYVERYEEFAEYCNEQGILVIGNDHLGHGNTAKASGKFGYFCEKDMSKTVVEDLVQVTDYAKEQYPGVPIVLLGHSMGSFLARRYLMNYGDRLQGAILSGTGGQPAGILLFGKLCASVIGSIKGEDYPSGFLNFAAFGNYNAKIKHPKSVSDWLTRDEACVREYDRDPFCNYLFTVNGYRLLFETLEYIQQKEHISGIPKALPILFVSGEQDPVGNYGKGVRRIEEEYRAAGMENLTLKLYAQDRHELLHELDKKDVYEDILQWIRSRY